MSRLLLLGKLLKKRATLASLLAKYGSNAHAYIPGASGVSVSGLPTNNYLLSTGSTGYSSTDSVVGLVLDGMGTVGSELVTNGTFTTDTTGWTATKSTLSVSSNELLITNTSGYGAAYQSFTTVVGKTYQANCTARAGTSNPVVLGCGNSTNSGALGYAQTTSVTNVTLSVTFVATATTTFVSVTGGPAGVGTAYADNISVREITGIHASQSTTANKPILRRGLVNLLTYSNDLSNAVYSNSTHLTRSVGGWKEAATTAEHRVIFASPTTGTLTHVAKLKPDGRNRAAMLLGTPFAGAWFDLVAGTTGALTGVTGATASSISDFDAEGYRYCAITCVLSGTSSSGAQLAGLLDGATDYSITFAGDITKGLLCPARGIITGSYTAQQILAQGGIPVTTTAAASNPLAGSYSWSFDGSNDSLALGSVPFQMSDDHIVVAVVNPNAAGQIFSIASTSSNAPRVADLSINASGYGVAAWQDNAGVSSSIAGSVNLRGAAHVITAWVVGGARVLRVDGLQIGTNATVLGATTVNNALIGALGFASPANHINANIYSVIPVKGTFALADVIAIERLVAQQAGITIA